MEPPRIVLLLLQPPRGPPKIHQLLSLLNPSLSSGNQSASRSQTIQATQTILPFLDPDGKERAQRLEALASLLYDHADRARVEPAGYVIKLQHTIITLMTESGSYSAIVIPSLPSILSTLEDTRTGVVTMLSEQYQRMTQARSLSMVLSSVFTRGPAITLSHVNSSARYKVLYCDIARQEGGNYHDMAN